MRPYASLALICVALSAAAAWAQAEGPAHYGPWRSSMIGGGGYIQNVVLCPSNPRRVYAYVDVGGIYRSDDGGRRWRMLHGAWPAAMGYREVRCVIVDPRDDRRVMAAVGGQWQTIGVLVSQDAGETWRQTLRAPFWGNGNYRWAGVLLARSPVNLDLVLAASIEHGVYRSTDNGETWQPSGATGLFPSDLRFDRANAYHVWLCAQGQKEWFDEAERDWKPGFFVSHDGGRSWRKISDEAPSEVLQDPIEARRLYGLFDGMVRTSTDDGATWQPFADGLPPRTTSEGYTREDEFQSLAAGPDFVLTASTKGTFYRRRFGERAWQKVARQSIEERYEGQEWFGRKLGYFGSALASIVIDPQDANHWFFTDWFSIYQTWDAGRNWALTIDGIEDTVIHTLAQDPSRADTVYLGMADDGYFLSHDGGRRFTHIGGEEGISNNAKCLAPAPSNPDRIYATGTRDWGWEANQVFVSDDHGRTWRRPAMTGLPDMGTHRCDTIAVDPRQAQTVYLGVSGKVAPGEGGVYRSTNGGESWEWMGRGLPEGEPFFAEGIWSIGREVAVDAAGALLAISRDRGLVFRFDQAEGRWVQSPAELAGAPNSLADDPKRPGRFFLAAGAIYRTDDGGRAWRKVFGDSCSHVTVDFAHPNRVAAGTSDGVALSEDGGETWRVLDRRLPDRRDNIVAFCGDRLLAGSEGSGVFWMTLP